MLPRVFFITILLAAAACSDPQCQPDELKVGTLCREVHTLPDAGTDAPEARESVDGSLGHAAVDGAVTQDGTGLEDAGGALDTGNVEALLDMLPGGPPSFQFRADTVTLSGGAITAIPNRRGPDALVVKAGILKSPTLDAEAEGAARVAFNGTQRAQSDLPASTWRFLHDVASGGAEVFNVFRAPLSGTQVLWSTLAGAGAQEVIAATGVITEQLVGYADVVSAAGAVSVNALTYADSLLSALERTAYAGAAVSGSLYTGSSNATDPSAPFTLGATPSGGSPATMDWYETIIFTRALHEYERQLVREYLAARYGIAAPSLTGADRDIMSLLPFSYLDAEYYSTAAGKVTAFGDRARPGHTFAQASPGNQVVNPVAEASFGNAPAATFVSATQHFYESSLPAAAWAFLHNGTGCAWDVPYIATSATSTTLSLLGTSTGGNAIGMSAAMYPNSTVANGSVRIIDVAPGAQQVNVGTAKRLSFRYAASSTPDYSQKNTGQTALTGNCTGSPSAAAPSTTLRLGRFGNLYGSFKFPGAVFFNRVLTADEEARLSAALQAKWGALIAKYGKGL